VAESSIRLIVDAAGAVNPLKRVTKETKKLDKATRDASGRLRNAKGHFIGIGTGARGAAKGVNALGGALKAALLPLAGFAVVSKFFQGFQEADRAAAAVKTLGVNAKDLQKELEGVAKRSGGLASTTQLMAAAYDVASAGFSNASDNSKILEASLKGAIGGMSDVATVSDAATSVLNSYGLSADKAGKLIDGFIQTQNDGKIIVGQYAGQIGRLAPIASAAGVGIDELNAAIATTTASGVPVESTFAGLRQGIASILKPSSEAQKLAEALGIEFNAAGLKAKGFGGLIDEVNRKTGGSTTAMTTLFGSVEAVGAILPIASGNMETFNKNLDNQRTKSGQSADAALVMGDTVSQSIVKMINKISDLIRKLDTVLGPAINGIITIINSVIDAATGAISTLEHLFSLSKNTTIAIQTIKGGNIAEGFGRSLMGIDELIGEDRRKALQKEAGFDKVFGVNREERDSKFLELLRKQPEIKVLIEGPQKTTDLNKPVVTENPELLALRERIRQLLEQQSKSGTDSTGQAEAQLKSQMAAAQSLSTEFERQIQLTNELDDAKDRILQRDFEIADLNAKFPDLKDKEIEKLKELIHKLHDAKEGEIARTEAANDAAKAAEAARKAQEADPLFQMQQQFKELIELENQVAAGATSIGNAFADAFGDVVTGARTGQEALAGMLKSIASDFLAMAKKIIAQQLAMILYGTIMRALGIGGGFMSPAASPGGSAGVAGIGGGGLGDVFGNTSSFGTFAEGGFVNKPTNALIGEGGEPEYVVPASKMNEAMGRYARGARGSAVIPDGSGGDAGGEMGGGGGSIDVTYSVERINNVNYVTAAEFEKGMAQAAKRGAEMGKRGVYSDLVNKRSIRSRIGV